MSDAEMEKAVRDWHVNHRPVDYRWVLVPNVAIYAFWFLLGVGLGIGIVLYVQLVIKVQSHG